MLGLKLRDEFLSAYMRGTAISLRSSDKTGAIDLPPEQILSITYPTADIQTALRALSQKRQGRPIVVMGDRGRGKSHILAVMHHAIESSKTVEAWIRDWEQHIGVAELQNLEIEKGFFPISEPVHNHEYPLLWNLIFERHPKGQYYRGQFEQLSQPFPPRSLLEKMFEDQPVALILDEFQKWFDGLHDDEGPSGRKWRESASNFIQNLSEIAKERPNILILVISVLNNSTDAFQQVHRNGPILIDFRGPTAKQDRQNLLLHRLFENRANIQRQDIVSLVSAYASERFRLLFPNKSEAERVRIYDEVVESWPFSPELIEILEDHILMAQAAQETRDLIRILAQVYRVRGDAIPVVTPGDFHVDDDACGVQSLLDSIATSGEQEKLREIAQRNLQEIIDAGIPVPNARDLVSTIWVRSMSPGKIPGGTPAQLHLDITRNQPVDDNAFLAELTTLVENSVNIHGDEVSGGPLRFGVRENPRSKVRACAKNDKLWQPGDTGASGGQVTYPAKDIEHVRNTLKHLLVPDSGQPASRVIVLGPNWSVSPWTEVSDTEQPSKWDRPVLLVVPDQIGKSVNEVSTTLGPWLAKNVPVKRNAVRFLLLGTSAKDIFKDVDLLYAARCSYLCSKEAWGGDTVYQSLHPDFDRPLRNDLKGRFSRFAILRVWDFQQPVQCRFEIEKISSVGTEAPTEVENKILSNVFEPPEFKKFVLERAKDSDFVGSLLDELSEPPPSNAVEAIPFLGETKTCEQILLVAAKGDIVLNVNGTWIGRRPEDTTEDDALRYIRSKAFRSGQEMRQIQLGLPGSVGGNAVSVSQPPGGETRPIPKPPSGGSRPGDGGSITGLDPTTPSSTGTVTPSPPGGVSVPLSSMPLPLPQTQRTEAPNTGINLCGCFEKWNIAATQNLTSAKLVFTDITPQQMKQILQRLPSAFKAELEVNYTEEAGDA